MPPWPCTIALGSPVVPEENSTHSGWSNGTCSNSNCAGAGPAGAPGPSSQCTAACSGSAASGSRYRARGRPAPGRAAPRRSGASRRGGRSPCRRTGSRRRRTAPSATADRAGRARRARRSRASSWPRPRRWLVVASIAMMVCGMFGMQDDHPVAGADAQRRAACVASARTLPAERLPGQRRAAAWSRWRYSSAGSPRPLAPQHVLGVVQPRARGTTRRPASSRRLEDARCAAPRTRMPK